SAARRPAGGGQNRKRRDVDKDGSRNCETERMGRAARSAPQFVCAGDGGPHAKGTLRYVGRGRGRRRAVHNRIPETRTAGRYARRHVPDTATVSICLRFVKPEALSAEQTEPEPVVSQNGRGHEH